MAKAPQNLDNMGLWSLGSLDLIMKRKFRWTFEIAEICGDQYIPANFCKVANKPELTIEETELNFLHSKTWLPGKAAWSETTVTYYDVATVDLSPLWSWLVSVYGFMPSSNMATASGEPNYFMGSRQGDYVAKGYITEWDGCGQAISCWTLKYLWPKSIKFGELDYSSSDAVELELTMRYSDARYDSFCPEMKIKQCCTPCETGDKYQKTRIDKLMPVISAN